MREAAIDLYLSKASNLRTQCEKVTLMRLLPAALRLICAFVLPACAFSAATIPSQSPQKSPSILQSLPNAEYPHTFTSTGKARLRDGVFEEPVAPGSAATIRIRLGNEHAIGDVNGDGAEDAAVMLVVDPGSSGTFFYLVMVLNEKGTARALAPVLLGDRVRTRSMVIRSGRVVVTMLTRRPDEPMSAQPDVEVVREFTLQGDILVETK